MLKRPPRYSDPTVNRVQTPVVKVPPGFIVREFAEPIDHSHQLAVSETVDMKTIDLADRIPFTMEAGKYPTFCVVCTAAVEGGQQRFQEQLWVCRWKFVSCNLP
jgi:hypothetical protein